MEWCTENGRMQLNTLNGFKTEGNYDDLKKELSLGPVDVMAPDNVRRRLVFKL